MSKRIDLKITCSDCSTEYDTTVYRNIVTKN